MAKQNKKAMANWIWILIILIIIAIGIGIYFFLTKGSTGSQVISSGSNSIPQPPALP